MEDQFCRRGEELFGAVADLLVDVWNLNVRRLMGEVESGQAYLCSRRLRQRPSMRWRRGWN